MSVFEALLLCDRYVSEHPASPAYGAAECAALRAVILAAVERYATEVDSAAYPTLDRVTLTLQSRLERDWLPSMPRLALR